MYAKIVTFWNITRDLCYNIEAKKNYRLRKAQNRNRLKVKRPYAYKQVCNLKRFKKDETTTIKNITELRKRNSTALKS